VRILVAEPIAAEGVALLRASHEVDERHGLSRDELCAILPDYDALIVRSQVKVDAGLISAGARLVVIGRAGVGVDNVDLDAATRAGIMVVNAPTGNTIAAAEHTLALLYGLARPTPRFVAGSGNGRNSPGWSCGGGPSGSWVSARSGRPSPFAPSPWR
jgi:D-3-phosphoglycerate dehydrogenase